MKLRAYLDQHDLTVEAFAARVGRSAATISRIARGLNRPDWQTMTAIETATAGAVTPNDYRDLPAEDATPEAASAERTEIADPAAA